MVTASNNILTLDGPSGVGKGTLAIRLARHLGWHFLDSGALYRILAWLAQDREVAVDDLDAVIALLNALDVSFRIDDEARSYTTWVNGERVGDDAIRTEACGVLASKLAAQAAVREALCDLQRHFNQSPGLVADGRDMGTVIFPDAPYKFYLDADVSVRAKRRHLQLQAKGEGVSFAQVLADLEARDRRDQERKASPLRPAEDALCIDTSTLSPDAVFERVRAALGEAATP